MDYNNTRFPWGKFVSPTSFHPLEHHCADVAACFEALLADPVVRGSVRAGVREGAAWTT